MLDKAIVRDRGTEATSRKPTLTLVVNPTAKDAKEKAPAQRFLGKEKEEMTCNLIASYWG